MHEPHNSVWDKTNEKHADKLVDSVTDLQHNVYNVKCITLGSYQLNRSLNCVQENPNIAPKRGWQ